MLRKEGNHAGEEEAETREKRQKPKILEEPKIFESQPIRRDVKR